MPSSPLGRNEPIINDGSPDHLIIPPPGQSKGLDLSLRTAAGYAGVAEPFPDSLLIPRSEWQARIQEMEEQKSRISDLCDQVGLPVKDQNGTNYCWINGPTHCVEIVRVVENQEMVILSPASAGAQIKNYRNVGGWGREGLEWIVDHGVCPVDAWPANAISRQYATEANKQLAMRYRVTEWWELEPNNIDQLITCLFMRLPVAIGLSWWSHEVTAVDPVWLDGTAAIRISNSWGAAWGTNGRGILQGRKMSPDDAVVPRVAVAA